MLKKIVSPFKNKRNSEINEQHLELLKTSHPSKQHGVIEDDAKLVHVDETLEEGYEINEGSNQPQIAGIFHKGPQKIDAEYQKRLDLCHEISRQQCHIHITDQRYKLTIDILDALREDYLLFNRQRLNIFRRYLWPSALAIQYALNDYEMLNDKPDLWLYCDETGYKIPSGSTGESHVIIMEEIIQTMRNSYTRGTVEQLEALRQKHEVQSQISEERYERVQKAIEILAEQLQTYRKSAAYVKMMKPWILNNAITTATKARNE